MTFQQEENSREELEDNHPIWSFPILQGLFPESTDPMTEQRQQPAQEKDVLLTSVSQQSSNPENHSTEDKNRSTSQSSTRQRCCHHSVMERQFCMDPEEICDSCGRQPFLKWFYVCTEDTSGFSDPIDPIKGPFLSPWIIKGIENGNYTEEETEIVIQQKLNVVRTAERERGPMPSPLSTLYTESDAEQGSRNDVWVRVKMDVSQDQNFFETDQPAAQSQQGSPSFHYHLAPLPRSICAFKACRSCERRHGVLEERTWLSLNEICSDPNILPPKSWELLRRPISSARVLRNIGQHCKDTNRQVQSFGDRSEQRLDTGRIRLYSRTNITSTNLHELVEKSLAITGS